MQYMWPDAGCKSVSVRLVEIQSRFPVLLCLKRQKLEDAYATTIATNIFEHSEIKNLCDFFTFHEGGELLVLQNAANCLLFV